MGKLVPAKMGKNAFLVVYNELIDSSINSQTHAFAIAKKAIDRDDLGKIIAAYRDKF